MTPNPFSSATVRQGIGEGVALAQKAEDSGDGKSLVDWLARNPGLAAELADFLAVEQGLGRAMGRMGTAPVRVGAAIGGYELGAELGRGGMGVVHRAFDPALNQARAVKLLRADCGVTAVEVARFRYEAEVVASLDHPNIVRVLTYGETDSGPYLVMPLMAGGSLAAWLKGLGPDRQLAPKKAAEIVRAVALGVHHAHQRGLIHRDLKPGNILLDAAGTPHVADFGLARRVDATASTAAGIAGTVAYMAPEQGRGEKQLTTAVDIYALGVVLFELLTGGVPYGGSDAAGILLRLTDVTEPVPPVRHYRPDAPADLAAICARCLEKRPEDRYASAQELADDLERFLDDRPVQAQPPGFWDWLRQLARIRPPDTYATPFWPVTAWFGVLILLTNVAVYGLVRADGAAAWVWVANSLGGVGMYVALWWYMLRRFREVPVIDRHSLIVATGCVFLYFPLLAAYVPLSLTVPARAGSDLYPALAATTGLGVFILGSTNWSRFFPLGLLMMGLIPVLARWPEEAPLVYGGYLPAVMWYWTYFGIRDDRRARRMGRADATPPVG